MNGKYFIAPQDFGNGRPQGYFADSGLTFAVFYNLGDENFVLVGGVHKAICEFKSSPAPLAVPRAILTIAEAHLPTPRFGLLVGVFGRD